MAALVLAPLFFNVFSSRVFEPDKISLLRTLALIMLLAWLLKLVNGGPPGCPPSRTDSETETRRFAGTLATTSGASLS